MTPRQSQVVMRKISGIAFREDLYKTIKPMETDVFQLYKGTNSNHTAAKIGITAGAYSA